MTMRVNDAFGNSTTTLTGTKSAVTNALVGVAVFSTLSVTGIGTFTLTALAVSRNVNAGSSSFTILAGSAAKPYFTTQPANAAAGASLGNLTVHLTDAYGNLVAQPGLNISLATRTGPGTLCGTMAVATNANGQAAFSNISESKAGTYTLTATGVSSAASSPFTDRGRFAVDPVVHNTAAEHRGRAQPGHDQRAGRRSVRQHPGKGRGQHRHDHPAHELPGRGRFSTLSGNLSGTHTLSATGLAKQLTVNFLFDPRRETGPL